MRRLSLMFLLVLLAPATLPAEPLLVPSLPQKPPGDWTNTRNCGPAAVLMVLGYNSHTNPTEQDIRAVDDWLLANKPGYALNGYNGSNTNTGDLVRIAREYGSADAFAARHWTEAQLKEQLALGRPVIVAVWTHMNVDPAKERQHFMVLTGMNDATVQVNDPGRSRVVMEYSLTSFRAAWESQNRSVVVVTPRATPTPPPSVRFTMRYGPQQANQGEALTAFVPSSSDQALVTLTDQSEPGVGTIVRREWRVNTQSDPLDVGSVEITRGFTTTGPPAAYIITLIVENDAGGRASADATLIVRAPTTVFEDPSLQIVFSKPATDSTGAVYVVRSRTNSICGFGFCGAAVEKISPAGSRWVTPELTSDLTALRGLSVGPDNTIFFQFERDGLYALTPDGQRKSGWPVRVRDSAGSGERLFAGAPLIDSETGMLFLLARPFAQGDFRASVLVGVNPDGSQEWHLEDREIGNAFLGPAANVYTLSASRFGNYDRRSGVPVCETTNLFTFNSAVGSKAGIFSAYREIVAKHDYDCSAAVVFQNTGRTDTVVQDARFNMVFAIDRPDGPFDLDTLSLFAITVGGEPRWRNTEFIPIRVLGSYGSLLFVLGREKGDPAAQLIFAVDALFGTLQQAIPLTGWCDGCDENMTIDLDGNLYFARENKVYRIAYPYF